MRSGRAATNAGVAPGSSTARRTARVRMRHVRHQWRPLSVCLLIADWMVLARASRAEVGRVRAPAGTLEGVLMVCNGGATAAFWYAVFLVPAGRTVDRQSP